MWHNYASGLLSRTITLHMSNSRLDIFARTAMSSRKMEIFVASPILAFVQCTVGNPAPIASIVA